MRRPRGPARFALLLALCALASLGSGPCGEPPKVEIEAEVRITDFGIPHIKATNFAGLGYGLGYSYARDNLCILAREIVTARGEETKYFGLSSGYQRRSILFTHLSREENLRALFESQPREIRDAVQGYAAGYNRWLEETGVDDLPAACAGQPWVMPITWQHLAAVHLKGNTRASLSPLNSAIVGAAPPAPAAPTGFGPASEAAPAFGPGDLPADLELPAELRTALNLDPGIGGGSNAYGLGGDATSNGRGMLLGNPHEPWNGIQRFYQAHLTVPGEYDVMGVTQIALPVIVIGFNHEVAWSHTISTAKRFTVHELSLDPADPLAYTVLDDNSMPVRHEIEAIPVEYEVLGESTPRNHTLYRSHFGFMISLEAVGFPLPWGSDISALGGPESVAYTVQDANERNTRGISQWFQMGRSGSVRHMYDRLADVLGMPFVNTIAADKWGEALYADVGTVPHVTEAKLQACGSGLVAQLFLQNGLIALDGSQSECDVGSDPGTPQPGILGPENLPALIRSDYVTNSNDSYWLSNPEERLEGFPPVLRRDALNEVGPRILRTRIGILQVIQRLAGADGLPGDRFDLPRLQEIFYGNRNYSAELELDGILGLCTSGSPPLTAWPTSGGSTVDATQACSVLAGWDRTDNLESVGVAVWRQFFRRLGREVSKFAVPFDPADPVNTPNTLILTGPKGDAVVEAFGDAIAELQNLGIPLDAPLGQVQYVTDDDQPRAADGSNAIPMHGGTGQNGVFNVVSTGFGPEGYTPVGGGPTYMQTITWDDEGHPVAEALLGFSQSDDPESPHFADQTRLYARKDFVQLPFREHEIREQLVSSEMLYDAIVIE